MNLEQLQFIKEYLLKHLNKGFIINNNSPFTAPILFAKKSSRDWRFCMDYRWLNSHIEIDPYPLSLIDKVLAKLQEATIFTKIDVRHAFNQIYIHPDSEGLIAFRICYRTFQYRVFPFKLYNKLTIFQQYINEVLFDLLVLWYWLQHITWPAFNYKRHSFAGSIQL